LIERCEPEAFDDVGGRKLHADCSGWALKFVCRENSDASMGLPFGRPGQRVSDMSIELPAVEVRVLGALMEKAITTPEYYPLTLNSLTLACNQKSSRDPVTDYTEDEVFAALDSLRDRGYAMRVDQSGARAPKFRHQLGTRWELDERSLAILTVLFLRGAQTVG